MAPVCLTGARRPERRDLYLKLDEPTARGALHELSFSTPLNEALSPLRGVDGTEFSSIIDKLNYLSIGKNDLSPCSELCSTTRITKNI